MMADFVIREWNLAPYPDDQAPRHIHHCSDEAFYVLAPVPNLAAGIDWGAVKYRYRDAVYDTLERSCVPGLRESLVTALLFTPASAAS